MNQIIIPGDRRMFAGVDDIHCSYHSRDTILYNSQYATSGNMYVPKRHALWALEEQFKKGLLNITTPY